MPRASRATPSPSRSLVAQPTTRPENRSSTTARYSQPSTVARYVMSVTQTRSGAGAVNCRASRFGATGWVCRDWVGTRKARRRRAANPAHRMSRATRLRPGALPVGPQLRVHAGAAVAPAAGLVDGGNLRRHPGIPRDPQLHPAALGGVEAGAGHPQHPTQHRDGEGRLLRLDERELHAWSLAKKAAAFFRMSRSIRSVRFSRRNCSSSLRSPLLRAPVLRASRSASRTQSRNADSARSIARAAAATVLPSSRTSRTASALNASLNVRRFRRSPMDHSYRTAVRGVSTKSGQVHAQRRETTPHVRLFGPRLASGPF